MTKVEQATKPTDFVRADYSSSPVVPARIILAIDLEDGRLRITERLQAETAVPMYVWLGRELWLDIPITADAVRLTQAINAGEIDALVSRIVAGSTIEWDGNNHVGRLNADAQDARDELQAWLDKWEYTLDDNGGLWDAGDWLQYVDAVELGITTETTDDELEAIAERLEAEALADGVVLHSTTKHLEYMRDNLDN